MRIRPLIAGFVLISALLAHGQSLATDRDTVQRVEVANLLRAYFIAAREYAVLDMAELVSREMLEDEFKAILRSAPDRIILRSVKLTMSAEFIFAGSCKIHIRRVSSEKGFLVASISSEQSDYAYHYDFYLVEEAGKLRVNHKVFGKKVKNSNRDPDIDVCDVPINWNNPSILKQGEEPEEQRRRLGIPGVDTKDEAH